ncbi:alpha/beta hydrolase [Pseudomonas sp. 5P_3.1_Bac2]|uniref:alpha/beta hydrolase n=1 Tax=Pseudomonas sp. 5P_3.1_Bac2 TaxID=2971617 RepID=UPI0021CA5830|nr:alpha/beta hydrolase [Pseudomonas sp. 5P_3.1_Bac2]MCU1716215.1 alpha/beta hydrolase [Pseudomonas sp. 5P_3.1_Bac2]
MTGYVEQISLGTEQAVLRKILRGALRVLFRGLISPPTPVPVQRVLLRSLTLISHRPAGVTRSHGQLAGRPCEWHRAQASQGRALLYLHGGAYLIGAPNTHRSICANLAKRAQLDVCALDYRLAPEHPYPAARDDAVAAYQALLEQGYRPEQIVVGGDSAGGNLSLITTLQLRAQGLPLPRALLLFSPVTDFTGAQLHDPEAGDPLLHPAWMEQAIRLYCPPELAHDDPGLSPLYAELSGLPAMLIQVGEDESLRNDSLRLAAKAHDAGVAVQLQRYVGMWHVFQAHAGVLKVADRALADAARFIRAHDA